MIILKLIIILKFLCVMNKGGYTMVRMQTHHLNVSYGERSIIEGLSLNVPDKKITTIIGSNGCGKSTELKAITRIIPYQSGSIILDGKNISEENTKQLPKKIAILQQIPERANRLTVGELLSYGSLPYQKGL